MEDEDFYDWELDFQPPERDCPTCEGTGKLYHNGDYYDCPDCDGTGLELIK